MLGANGTAQVCLWGIRPLPRSPRALEKDEMAYLNTVFGTPQHPQFDSWKMYFTQLNNLLIPTVSGTSFSYGGNGGWPVLDALAAGQVPVAVQKPNDYDQTTANYSGAWDAVQGGYADADLNNRARDLAYAYWSQPNNPKLPIYYIYDQEPTQRINNFAGDTIANFIAGWRHIWGPTGVFRTKWQSMIGATFTYNGTTYTVSAEPLVYAWYDNTAESFTSGSGGALYPGDAYTDLVGGDGYNRTPLSNANKVNVYHRPGSDSPNPALSTTNSYSITAASYSSGVATITCGTATTFNSNSGGSSSVNIAGMSPSAWNKTVVVTGVSNGGKTFTTADYGSNPGSPTTFGVATAAYPNVVDVWTSMVSWTRNNTNGTVAGPGAQIAQARSITAESWSWTGSSSNAGAVGGPGTPHKWMGAAEWGSMPQSAIYIPTALPLISPLPYCFTSVNGGTTASSLYNDNTINNDVDLGMRAAWMNACTAQFSKWADFKHLLYFHSNRGQADIDYKPWVLDTYVHFNGTSCSSPLTDTPSTNAFKAMGQNTYFGGTTAGSASGGTPHVGISTVTPGTATTFTALPGTASFTAGGFAHSSAVAYTDDLANTLTGTPTSTDSNGSIAGGTVTIPFQYANGTHWLIATDAANNAGSSSFTVSVPRSITITSPASGTVSTAGTALVVAGQGYAGGTSVAFNIDSTSGTITTITTAADGTFGGGSVSTGALTAGGHTLYGYTTRGTATASFTATGGAPSLTLSPSTFLSTALPATQTAAVANFGSTVSVTYRLDGTSVGTATTSTAGAGTVSYTVGSSTTVGAHTVTATATGAASTASFTVSAPASSTVTTVQRGPEGGGHCNAFVADPSTPGHFYSLGDTFGMSESFDYGYTWTNSALGFSATTKQAFGGGCFGTATKRAYVVGNGGLFFGGPDPNVKDASGNSFTRWYVAAGTAWPNGYSWGAGNVPRNVGRMVAAYEAGTANITVFLPTPTAGLYRTTGTGGTADFATMAQIVTGASLPGTMQGVVMAPWDATGNSVLVGTTQAPYLVTNALGTPVVTTLTGGPTNCYEQVGSTATNKVYVAAGTTAWRLDYDAVHATWAWVNVGTTLPAATTWAGVDYTYDGSTERVFLSQGTPSGTASQIMRLTGAATATTSSTWDDISHWPTTDAGYTSATGPFTWGGSAAWWSWSSRGMGATFGFAGNSAQWEGVCADPFNANRVFAFGASQIHATETATQATATNVLWRPAVNTWQSLSCLALTGDVYRPGYLYLNADDHACIRGASDFSPGDAVDMSPSNSGEATASDVGADHKLYLALGDKHQFSTDGAGEVYVNSAQGTADPAGGTWTTLGYNTAESGSHILAMKVLGTSVSPIVVVGTSKNGLSGTAGTAGGIWQYKGGTWANVYPAAATGNPFNYQAFGSQGQISSASLDADGNYVYVLDEKKGVYRSSSQGDAGTWDSGVWYSTTKALRILSDPVTAGALYVIRNDGVFRITGANQTGAGTVTQITPTAGTYASALTSRISMGAIDAGTASPYYGSLWVQTNPNASVDDAHLFFCANPSTAGTADSTWTTDVADGVFKVASPVTQWSTVQDSKYFVMPSAVAGASLLNGTTVTVSPSTITTSVATQTITGVGTNFAHSHALTFKLDGTTTIGSTTTDSVGAGTATLTIPANISTGTHTVSGTDTSSTASTSLTVQASVATLSITSAGTVTSYPANLTVAGSNWTPSGTVTMRLNNATGAVMGSVVATSGGTFGGGTATVAPGTPSGSDTLYGSDGTKNATASFTVNVPYAMNVVGAPVTVSQLPSSVQATGSGFVPSGTVAFLVDAATAVTSPATVTSDANGHWGTATVTIPVGLANGVHSVTASDTGGSAQSSFSVAIASGVWLVEGFEHGVRGSSANGLISGVVTPSSMTVSSAYAKNGGYGLGINSAGTVTRYDFNSPGGQVTAFRYHLLTPGTLPAGSTITLQSQTTTAGGNNVVKFGYNGVSGHFAVQPGNAAWQDISASASPSTWYTVEGLSDITQPTWSSVILVNGTNQGTITAASQGTTTFKTFRLGNATSDTYGGYFGYDDIIVSNQASDFPFGEGQTVGLFPVAVGPASAGVGVFSDQAGNALDTSTTYWNLVNTVPLNSSGTYVKQIAAGTADFLAVTVASNSTVYNGVSALAFLGSGGTGATCDLRVLDNGQQTVVYTGQSPSAGSAVWQALHTAQSNWTQSEVDALDLSFGYSPNAGTANYPIIYNVMLQADSPTSTNTLVFPTVQL